jgi:hypothetical protein
MKMVYVDVERDCRGSYIVGGVSYSSRNWQGPEVAIGEKKKLPMFDEEMMALTKELLRVAQCPNCDGSGVKLVRKGGREYVTRDMALDAGDRDLEGTVYRDIQEDYEPCQWCDERAKVLSYLGVHDEANTQRDDHDNHLQ